MRFVFRATLSCCLLMLITFFVAPGSDAIASPVGSAPDKTTIEELLKSKLARGYIQHPGIKLTETPINLLQLYLRQNYHVTGSSWSVKVVAMIDFGTAQAGVVGFSRRRAMQFSMKLRHDGAHWQLVSFHPVGTVIMLPIHELPTPRRRRS